MRFQTYIFIAILTLISSINIRAQYYSVNIDSKTAASMIAAYGTGTAAEIYYNGQIKKILEHYKSAEVSAAGIFASKYLDRKALTELGIWSSSTENHYYRRIYNMVSSKIMPKIWTIGGMMLKSPQNTLYWCPYIIKTCDDTKTLCMQFESIVTNSRLSFKDLVFLQVNSQVAELLCLGNIGGINFRAILDGFTEAAGHITKDNIKADLTTLYQKGVATVISGFNERVLQSGNINKVLDGKVEVTYDIIDSYKDMFEAFQSDAGDALFAIVGGKDAVSKLFSASDYNLTSWTDNYMRESDNSYYTQRWYIIQRNSGIETLCNYTPSFSYGIIDDKEWTIIDGAMEILPSQLLRTKRNSEEYAGWSKEKIDILNLKNDGGKYSITYDLITRDIESNTYKAKAYAYSIKAIREWNSAENFEEYLFDSYSMDMSAFQSQLNARILELNDNEQGYSYEIKSDNRNWYQIPDSSKIKGIEAVSINVTCSECSKLGEGATQYKCWSCGSSLSEHTKKCSMETTIDETSKDFSDLEKMRLELEGNISGIKTRISDLEAENSVLVARTYEADIENISVLREKYNSNKDEIESLNKELVSMEDNLKKVNQAISEAQNGENVQTDEYYKIPAIMHECQQNYNLIWDGEGAWNGYTFTRMATMPEMKSNVTFTAKLTISRKPKYFLGIQIQRAIIQIDWSLSSDYSGTQVVDVVTFQSSMSQDEKTELLSKRISEAANTYPGCKISTEYIKSAPVEGDNSKDTYHLLWSSDRLEIAREIDSRLTKIYADLVSLEKMMSYKYTYIDFLKDITEPINLDQGRKLDAANEALKNWKDNARHSNREKKEVE